MKYDIYFHNDFDGGASAALMTEFLKSRGEGIKNYFPIDYGEISDEKRWFSRKFKNPSVILDFLYHPAAIFWFDHHVTPFIKKDWQKKFRADKRHCWGQNYPSAYHLILDSLKKNFDFQANRHFQEITYWADIIDGARYVSAKQPIEMKEPALQINAFIKPNKQNPAVLIWLVKILGKESLAETARRPKIKKIINRLRKEMASALEFCKKNIKIFNRVAFLDLSQISILELKYVTYYFYPNLSYSLLLSKRNLLHLNVGFNPWRKKKNRINIGQLLKKYGGGGHKNVGGLEIKDHREAIKIVNQIINFLNKNG